MGQIYVFIITLLLVLVSEAHCSCPNGWNRHGTTCYHFSHDTESMLVANMACQQMGGALVEIETAGENAYLAAESKTLNIDYLWIGLSDIQEETVWQWNKSKDELTTPDYVNWRAGEPNNQGGDENCVVMDTSYGGQWVDQPCHTIFHYICEKKDMDSEVVG